MSSSRILVFGAGTIGSIYAAGFAHSGHSVTVLTRDVHADRLRTNGLVVENAVTGQVLRAAVPVIEGLDCGVAFDFVFVTVGFDQLETAIVTLQGVRPEATLVFFSNNPTKTETVISTFGASRVLFGFPGLAGSGGEGTIRYAAIRQQPTTLGIPDGGSRERLRHLRDIVRSAGFATVVEPHMESWLACHAMFVAATSGAIYASGGDCRALAHDRRRLRQLVIGVRDGFGALRTLGHTIRPLGLRVLFDWAPTWFASGYWERFLASDTADLVFGSHARAAVNEMAALASECRGLLKKSGVQSQALDDLFAHIDRRRFQSPPVVCP